MKKVLLYNPYLDVMGGGERHIVSIMEVLAQKGYEVHIAWDDRDILTRLQNTLRIQTKGMSIIPNFFRSSPLLARTLKTKDYDMVFYVTDGSYFPSLGKRNFIFAMYPRKSLYSQYPLNWLKTYNYEYIANGDFTAEMIGTWLHKRPHVLYPYIDQDFFKESSHKSHTILSVGRLFTHLHAKRQDILIKAFKKLKDDYPAFKDYSLCIAGGLKDEDKDYYSSLLQLAEGRSDIQFKLNIGYEELLSCYQDALIYWHAAGVGVDERREPEKVEHVGISPLEAMASQCVTICHASGGPKRYIAHGQTGYLYTTPEELILHTVNALADIQKSDALVQKARQFVSVHFSYPVFKNKVEQILHI